MGYFGGSVSYSTDDGTGWSSYNTGLLNSVTCLATAPDGFVYAGTTGGGIYRTISRLTSVSGNHSKLPENYSINQNYPNPFNPWTVIGYQLPVNSFVTLKVYDVIGREVTTLVDEREQAGTHNVKFDGTDLPSGVYLYQIIAGNYISTKKMLLLK